MNSTCESLLNKKFTLEEVVVTLGNEDTKKKDQLFVVKGEISDGFCIQYPGITGEPAWLGIKISVERNPAQPQKDQLILNTVNEIPNSNIATILDHPFTQFRLGSDGKGLGIADIRDLRTGGQVRLRFDLYATGLVLAVIPDSHRPSLVLGWNSNYSPF